MVKLKDENSMTNLLVVHLFKFMRWLNGALFMSLVVCKMKDFFPFCLLWSPSGKIYWQGIWIFPYTCLFKTSWSKKLFLSNLLLQIGMMERSQGKGECMSTKLEVWTLDPNCKVELLKDVTNCDSIFHGPHCMLFQYVIVLTLLVATYIVLQWIRFYD